MRSIVVRRTALAASVAAFALLVTACGGSSDSGGKGSDGKSGQGDKGASAAPAAVRALGAAELDKAALAQADVKSGKVGKVAAKDDVPQDKVSAKKADCAPLAYLQSGTYVGKPSASVKRTWVGDAKKPKAGASAEDAAMAGLDRAKVLETLASYGDGGAEQAMKDLKTAARKCAGGFTYTVTGTENQFEKVTTTPAPGGADEALALTLTMDAGDGVKAPVKTVVVRKGATLAYLPAINLASAAGGKDFDFPTEIVDAQLAKLK
ncbi:hypothetical protein RKE30_04170 [Streptomyces sp. Li-HN-5-11]|uniref:hypothetical protein n=1 Tax=Streptomyces sp. Li-HN-5-11 TaxID=3075432 RepID=UPI0028AE41C0|nr:hypothetical protein [Streptomyces sp. Li-HN-5-11]WNM29647.1 hypothetical protein RKE30_04170 [Streptomyces sp. Li-HN-5-11]